MALNVAKINHVSRDRQDTVRGYMRKNWGFIPEEIIKICILFYAFSDEFDEELINLERLDFDKNAQSLTKSNGTSYDHVSAYLKNVVESGVHRWKFKIVRRTDCMLIGIWKVQKGVFPPINTYFTHGANRGYAYSLSAGMTTTLDGGYSSKGYAVICRGGGDIVEMILDFDDCSLSFKVNGKDYGKAYKDLMQGQYRAAVYFGFTERQTEKSDKIQLLE